MDGMGWFNWMVENPTAASIAALSAAAVVLLIIILLRLAFAALGRRVLVGLGVRKKVEQESHWATAKDRAEYGMRPPVKRKWYDLRSAK